MLKLKAKKKHFYHKRARLKASVFKSVKTLKYSALFFFKKPLPHISTARNIFSMTKYYKYLTVLLVISFLNSTSMQGTGQPIQEPDFVQNAPCINNQSYSYYECNNIGLQSQMSLKSSGITSKTGNDIWGWTDPLTNKEYAIMGLNNKTSFVDVTDPQNPVHIGDLTTHTYSSLWRDIKVYNNHAYIVSEAYKHGLQIFDLTLLRNQSSTPAVFQETAHYNLFGSAHNIFINEHSSTAYVVGANNCDAGMHMVDLSNPTSPEFIGCVDKSIFEDVDRNRAPKILHGEDYTHDVQCVIYKGPDTRYTGQEICIASNADTVNIVDVTDKMHPTQLSVKNYANLGYVHQGWLTEDHRFFVLGDELDEQRFGHNTRTHIWDVSDLKNPTLIGTYTANTKSIDHNMYVHNGLIYQANYLAGLRVLSTKNISRGQLNEVAFFDTNPNEDRAKFDGVWSVYPFFKSGNLILSGFNGRLYIVSVN